MKAFSLIACLLAVLFFLAAGAHLTAQSTNPDRPTVLNSGQLQVSLPNNQTKYYYTFLLREGELKLTADVSGAAGGIRFEIVDEDFKNIGPGSYNGWATGTPSKRHVSRYNSTKRQKVILILISSHVHGNSLALRIEGAAEFGQISMPATTSTSASTVPGRPTDATPAPASGASQSNKVVVVLKNGQTLTGRYDSRSYTRNGFNNKLIISLQGREIPPFEMEEVESITIYKD
jgi:hypothetical protein